MGHIIPGFNKELIEFVRAVHMALQRILQRSGMGADVSNYLPDEHVE
jgi:hypothetical protein